MIYLQITTTTHRNALWKSHSFCILPLDTVMFRKSLRSGDVKSTRSRGVGSHVEAVEFAEKSIIREEYSYTVREIGIGEAESIVLQTECVSLRDGIVKLCEADCVTVVKLLVLENAAGIEALLVGGNAVAVERGGVRSRIRRAVLK